jgi:hypothetical protein
MALQTRRTGWDLEDEYEQEWEAGLEGETLAHQSARFTLRLNLSQHGFLSTDQFLDDWIRSGGRFPRRGSAASRPEPATPGRAGRGLGRGRRGRL